MTINDDQGGAVKKEVDAARPEPPPGKGVGNMTGLVITDLHAREAFGVAKYGTALQAHNGRDALMDAYQEVLDLVKYLRQVIFERDGT